MHVVPVTETETLDVALLVLDELSEVVTDAVVVGAGVLEGLKLRDRELDVEEDSVPLWEAESVSLWEADVEPVADAVTVGAGVQEGVNDAEPDVLKLAVCDSELEYE